MDNYNQLANESDSGGSRTIFSSMMMWWSYRTTMEKSLIVTTTLLSILSVLILIYGSSKSGQQRDFCSEPQSCVLNHKMPYTVLKVAQNVELQKEIGDLLMKTIDKDIIRGHLKNLTKTYHPAGSKANMDVMSYIEKTWRSYGLDKVETEEYDVLLSQPMTGQPNTLFFADDTEKTWTLISNGTSTPLGPQEALDQQYDETARQWWNAYAKNGTATGTIVNGAYCSNRDFKTLANLGITNLTGKIILCRYGGAWRGGMVYEAEKRNATGVILYLDPADYGPPKEFGYDYVFPKSLYVPPFGAQRGSLMQTEGDPTTPGYPSKNYTFRYYDESELRRNFVLPNIPVTTVGYSDVQKIYENMKNGIRAPENFTGGLNVTYWLNTTTNFQLNVYVTTERKVVRNVFGYIYGREEIDRWVLLSNHVDAWTYGAFDPNSGTAINLALSHAFMKTLNISQWKPRRTILFCAWDAEEYGLIGSQEWVEQKLAVLSNKAVAVINVDTAIHGNETLEVRSLPLLYRTIINATKKIPDKKVSGKLTEKTVYDTWLASRNKTLIPGQPDLPYIKLAGGGSDHKSFISFVGVPACDLRYELKEPIHSSYPLYHTMYEIDWTIENLADPDFETLLTLSRVMGEITRSVADSLVIPFNVTDYAVILREYTRKMVDDLRKINSIEKIVDNFEQICQELIASTDNFLGDCAYFQKSIDESNSGKDVSIGKVERLNSRLMALERAFILPAGLPGRPIDRHIVFATSEEDSYASQLFAGVRDTLVKFLRHNEDVELRKSLNLQLTTVRFAIESARDVIMM
uniref:Uncharacterized protein n=1 Tax=Romanomermis culicivorax TaxID=13658 RepID=A0A915IRY2_ROMCU